MAAALVLCTVPTEALAAEFAERLVAERLAACVQVTAVASWYRWQGAVERAAEWRLAIKTGMGRVPALAARLQALHPYDLPEIVALPLDHGSAAYLDWIDTMTATGGEGE